MNNIPTNVDVIIIGSGLAGTYLALTLPSSIRVLLVSSYENNSSLAQGGIASCMHSEDSIESHYDDTLKAGSYINEKEAVQFLVKEAPHHIDNLTKCGVQFDSDEKGHYKTTLEGGHSHKRVLHINGDQTGKGIMDTLSKELESRDNIIVSTDTHLLALNAANQKIQGATLEHMGSRYHINSKCIVMATGGIGDLYQHTTNNSGAYGSGMVIAHRIGAIIRDLRYIQFHPTAFYEPNHQHFFLISEALRGEGAYLIDKNLKRFMVGKHDLAELAPRDIVSRHIAKTMASTNSDCVYLDTRHMKTAFLKERFPNIFRHLKASDYTMGQDLIPVKPVAHYTIGGIVTDKEGRTNIHGLYACGEVASTGVHGANRLASNSLLECLVYSSSAAISIHRYLVSSPLTQTSTFVYPKKIRSNTTIGKKTVTTDVSPLTLAYFIKKSKAIMTKHAGIKRTDIGLETAYNDLIQIEKHLDTLYDDSLLWHEVNNRIYMCKLVIADALTHSSLGCHYKEALKTEERIC